MNASEGHVPVLEIGGTHVTAALVALSESVPAILQQHRMPLDSHAPADELVASLAAAAGMLGLTESQSWGVAIPGPFNYEKGIGLFEDVAKFDGLNGFDLGAALQARIQPTPMSIRFLNDADAFGLGECAAGAGKHHNRAICLTLGTGIGSAFISNGNPVNEGAEVPPDGSVHLLTWHGRPLEEAVSRRAMRKHYQFLTGESLDVHVIAERAREGEAEAATVLNAAMHALGDAMAPWAVSFKATVIVLGGSISGSWDILEQPFRAGLLAAMPQLSDLELRVAELPVDAALIGTAKAALPVR